jgi:hypothetical protein
MDVDRFARGLELLNGIEFVNGKVGVFRTTNKMHLLINRGRDEDYTKNYDTLCRSPDTELLVLDVNNADLSDLDLCEMCVTSKKIRQYSVKILKRNGGVV